MARMDWQKVRRHGAVMEAAKTFCKRCGDVFVPRRRHHALCAECAAKRFGS